VNSKKPMRPTPASAAAWATSTFTGVPVRASIDPAWAANASGSSSREGNWLSRTAMTTTTGSRAATAALMLINAVKPATSTIIRTSRRLRLAPASEMSCCPAQVVTPRRPGPR
jgi:hypothetical protein